MGERSTPQAQPVEGRTFPTKALGARPTYFDDGGATDAVVAVVTALAAEVWAVRERLATLEQLLDASGTVDRAAVEAHRPDEIEAASRAEDAAAFMGRVFRVFEEMREEAVAGETRDRYLGLVQRAFDEL